MDYVTRLSGVGLAGIMLAGCSDGNTQPWSVAPDQPASLRVVANGFPSGVVFTNPENRVQLSVSVSDGRGQVISGVHPELSTRNVNVAAVDSAGWLAPTGFGSTYVIARLNSGGRELVDSIPVSVPSGIACTADFRFGLNLTLTDSTTGALVTTSADIRAEDAGFVDEVRGLQGGRWWTAGERAGTYRLTVRAAGYRDWTRSGIVIGRDVCHVIPVAVTAKLVRP
jgi:hypothetical protein